jgi:hypothetical protein
MNDWRISKLTVEARWQTSQVQSVTATPNAMKDFTVVRMDFLMWLYLCPKAKNIYGHDVFSLVRG